MKIVLYCPQIPQNTGNIVRTCAVTGCELYLVRPLGFSTSDRMLKRAGLDYWEGVKVHFLDDLHAFLKEATDPVYFFSSHSSTPYTTASYSNNAILIFGSETAGLPNQYHDEWKDHFYTIPMRKFISQPSVSEEQALVRKETRCLNLSNAVSIVVYEALRQQQFAYE
ncbi:MAG: tRNA (cytidine(34)-2'-O)-methyltransferase [Rhabdochlamydiaceae bacterium]|nr:tRNA (cytidine(34)-2'-O)-methyltransferase [Rhabdochlamydiaceae bacterium]